MIMNNRMKGILWMLIGIFFMVCLDAVVKWLSYRYTVYQVLFIRNVVAVLVLLTVLGLRNEFNLLCTKRKGWHAARSLLAFIINFGFFYGLARQPLANVMAITFIAPSLVALLSVVVLRERVDIWRWLAIFIGLAGVWVILRPGTASFQLASLVILAVTFLYAVIAVSSRLLAATENSVSLTFYMLPISILVPGLMLPQHWVQPYPADWLLLIACGLLGLMGFWTIMQAFRCAPASVVSPFEYSSMIWAILFGALFWSEFPDLYTLLGAALVVCSSFLITAREGRSVPSDQ